MFWDIDGQLGHPVRATISEMGPALLARILALNDRQTGVPEVAFAVAGSWRIAFSTRCAPTRRAM